MCCSSSSLQSCLDYPAKSERSLGCAAHLALTPVRRIRMDFKPEKYEHESPESAPAPQSRLWIAVAVGASLLTTAVALGYGVHQQSVVGQLTSQNQEMTSTMTEMRSQMDTLSAKFNDVSNQAATAVTALQQEQTATTQNGGKSVSAKQRPPRSQQQKQ